MNAVRVAALFYIFAVAVSFAEGTNAPPAKITIKQGQKAPEQRAYSSAEIMGAKTYTIFELWKWYNRIKPGTLIIVPFGQVTRIESHRGNTFWVNLTDGSGKDLPAIVDEKGMSYFAPSENSLRQGYGSVYCTVTGGELTNEEGGYYPGPVIHPIGTRTVRRLGGVVEITW